MSIRPIKRRNLALLLSMSTGLGLAAAASLMFGAVDVPAAAVWPIVLDHLGAPLTNDASTLHDAVVWQIRAPRLLLGILVGGGLGVSGALLQGVFRNPLAEPSIIGVSGGATVGAIACIITGANFLGPRTISFAAFASALATTLLVYLLSRNEGRTDVVTLILVGIAVGLLASAFSGLMTSVADDDELRSIIFWSLGSLTGSTWSTVRIIAPMILIGCIAAVSQATSLDLMALGDRQAADLGVNVDRTRGIVLCLAALLTGVGVAVAGIIGFVGLVVPHLIRLLAGPSHRLLLPASVAGGALLVLAADLIARLAVEPRELPLGVVTALIGGPYFILLIKRNTRREGWS